MNEVKTHWAQGSTHIMVRVEGTEGPKHGRIAGGWAANYARKNNVKLTKEYDKRDWAYGFLHRTDVCYRVEAKAPAKGQFGGECFTPGCTNKARWFATAEPRHSTDYQNRYRCPDCCDLIAAKELGITKRFTGDLYREQMRGMLNTNLKTLRRYE